MELVATAGIKVGPEGFRENWNQCHGFYMLHVPLMAVVGSPAHATQLIFYSLLEVNREGLRLQQMRFSDGEGGVVVVSVYVGCNRLHKYAIDGDPIEMNEPPPWWKFVKNGFLNLREPTEYDRAKMVYPKGGQFDDPNSDASKIKAFWLSTFDRRTRCIERSLKDRVGDRPTGGWPCECNGQ